MPVKCGKKQRIKQTKNLDDEFHGRGYVFTQQQYLYCWFTTLTKYSRHARSLFGANIG